MIVNLSIVILLWSKDERFDDHLAAAKLLADSLPPGLELVIVENGFAHTSIEGRWPQTQVVTASTNLGVSAGWNVGLFATSGRNVCFLNQDARASVEDLLVMSDFLDTQHQVAIVGPSGSDWDFERIEHRNFVVPQATGFTPCDVVSGYCFTVRRVQAINVGGFDVHLSPCGYEEVDLALRMRLSNVGSCAALGGLSISHSFAISAAEPWRRVDWLDQSAPIGLIHERNTLYIRRKFSNASDLPFSISLARSTFGRPRVRYLRAVARRRAGLVIRGCRRYVQAAFERRRPD